MVKRQAPRASTAALASSSGSGYWTGAHTMHRLRFHLVWVPKYRKRVLHGPVAARLTGLLRQAYCARPTAPGLLRQACQACEVNAWGLHELSVQPDHVHLLLQVPPTASISQVMQALKGGSARVLRAEFPDLEEFLWGESFWGESFWGDGYFAETVGQTEEAVVRAYIRNQGAAGLARPRPKPWARR